MNTPDESTSVTTAAFDDEAVLLVGHGSRREKSNEQVRELAAGLESRLEIPVDAAFLELAEPAIDEAFATFESVVSRVTVVHCSLFAASHVKNDVPLAIEQARAAYDLEIENGAHLGIHPAIIDLLDDRAAEVEAELGVDREDDGVAVVLCGRGSSDPDANGDVQKLARLLYEGRDFNRVEATFIGVTEPTLEDTLHGLSKHRPDAVVVLPYMLGDGVLTQRVRDWTADFDDDYPYVSALAGDPLGTDSRLLDVFADRWQEARSGSVEMSCDTCKYKVDLEGYEEDVGGARAMLRALAHQEAHAAREDIDDEPHSHDAPQKHVTVCTNRTCADAGSTAVLERIRQEARNSERCDVRITRSSCLGRCGDGPMVAVYPDGIWYGDVAAENADRIVTDHLESDRIVSNLVEQIL
ncbi:cobalamin (vitamin B12) biosynthesis CbiX protein [Natrialba hulunbeirensis JCM 10989]|uniref:Cobalamin (Vitamin B12) biosynthesis CbiX protein n=1 Tax=Natrialba hulunbeirensis JCM 10989 TaxID=1227493 RepID=L9ZMY7_9EURY|nr:CbiX/SirB N-terminal domain-containing protein [Natrialba hulunbeirensis]ELY87734.1 cobalamin (vitamin B12) biosynthesis CbiX protein [Natrialba hulunbeirensis JCM 10989]